MRNKMHSKLNAKHEHKSQSKSDIVPKLKEYAHDE